MSGAVQQPPVIPAKAGTQRLRFFNGRKSLGSRLRGNDGLGAYSLLLFVAMMTASFFAFAQPASDPTPLQFQSPIEEQRFHDLVAELRCVMCQNQSLAESNAQIAVDLRREVLELMRQGKDNREIKQFLVERYGEFVLYRPQVESKTWLLWFGPALVLLAGGVVVAGAVRKRRQAPAATKTSDSNEEQEW
jgi:cytochrome c-type biogenesis protein CcmH